MWAIAPPPRQGPSNPRENVVLQWNGLPPRTATPCAPNSRAGPSPHLTPASRPCVSVPTQGRVSMDGTLLPRPHHPQDPRGQLGRPTTGQTEAMRTSMTSAPVQNWWKASATATPSATTPQPQPHFHPAEPGPKWIRNRWARTPEVVPVHVLLGTDPERHIRRVPSPHWEPTTHKPTRLPPMPPLAPARATPSPQPALPNTDWLRLVPSRPPSTQPSPNKRAAPRDIQLPEQTSQVQNDDGVSSRAFGSLLDWGSSARAFHSVECVSRRHSVKEKPAAYRGPLHSEENVKRRGGKKA